LLKRIRKGSGTKTARADADVLDYPGIRTALEELVGQWVVVHVTDNATDVEVVNFVAGFLSIPTTASVPGGLSWHEETCFFLGEQPEVPAGLRENPQATTRRCLTFAALRAGLRMTA